MRDSQPGADEGHRPQARPFGSSGLGAILAIGVFLLAIVVAGILILGDDGDGNDEFAVSPATPSATPETTPVLPTQPADVTPESQPSPTEDATDPTPRIFPTLTPTPTETPGPDPTQSDIVPTEPAEVEDPEEDEPVEEEPEEPVEVPPTPAEEPFAGEFGFLPPPQLPSGGAGQALDLDFQLGASLESVPTSAAAYQVQWLNFTYDEVALMAANIGLEGEPTAQGEGVYSVSDSASTLFVSPTVIEFSAESTATGGTLPSEGVAVDAAWSWFSALGIGGIPAGDAAVVAVEEAAGLSVVAITPSYPSPNLAPTPSARIKVSAAGAVEEARVVWPASLIESEYGLRPALDMWEDLRNGHAFLSADLSESGGGSGTMTVTDIWISYTIAGSPWEEQFIVPLLVFGGTATVNGSSVYVSAYVPAIYHQTNPLG